MNGAPHAYVNSYAPSMHNGNQPRINYQPGQQQQPSQELLESFCTIAAAPPANNNCTEIPIDEQIASEVNENLTEIIKKSIVETVTA